MALTEKQIEAKIRETHVQTMGLKTTVAVLTLTNGYEVVGTSACVNPDDYDFEIGKRFAIEDAKRRVWELEGYLAQESAPVD